MRKKLPKILTIIFLLVFIFQIAGLIFILLSPSLSYAKDPIKFTPQVPLDGVTKEITIKAEDNPIGKYIKDVYNYAIGIVGILATVVMMIGGIVWITAAGNNTRIAEAKAWIGASLSGLVLALTAYTILSMISPNLVNFKTPYIPGETEQKIPSLVDKYACSDKQPCIEKDAICKNNICVLKAVIACDGPGILIGSPCKLDGKSGHCSGKGKTCVLD